MSFNGKILTFEEFKTKLLEMKVVKPYRPIIIKTLLAHFPKMTPKNIIANSIRRFFKNNDFYEKYNIWDQLVDVEKMVLEENSSYSLNVTSLSEEQILELIQICDKKISAFDESMEFIPKPVITYTPKIINPEEVKKDSNQNSEESIIETSVPVESSNSLITIEQQLSRETRYFIYQIHANNQDELYKRKLSNLNDNLSNQERRALSIEKNQENEIILYDTKGDYVRIWGTAMMKFKSHTSVNQPNMDFSNFKPLIENEEIVKPKLLEPKYIKDSMFGSRRFIPISHTDFKNILYNVTDIEKLSEATQESDEVERILDYLPDDEILELPDEETIEYGIQELQDEILIDRDTIKEILIHLASGRHLLFAGPIGTGKTHLARRIPEIFWSNSTNNRGYRVKLYTATNDWNSDDILAGIIPRMDKGEPIYSIHDGCVVETVKMSWNDKSQNKKPTEKFRGTWLVIDEFNRADIDKVFGQLFTSLETRKVLIPTEDSPSLVELTIPKDYRIIGTLNTSDKHYLFKLSDALKRRFAFVEINPPNSKDKHHEIFYALLNAMKELQPHDFSHIITLDFKNKKIDQEKSDKEFIRIINDTYDIVEFIRIIKNMGTAILKSIFQTILIGSKIEKNLENIQDLGLNANIISQLERVSSNSIDMLLVFCFDDLQIFFRNAYNSNNNQREEFHNEFKKYIEFLKMTEIASLSEKFWNKKLTDESWLEINKKWQDKKSNYKIPRQLPKFKNSLEDLKKSFDVI